MAKEEEAKIDVEALTAKLAAAEEGREAAEKQATELEEKLEAAETKIEELEKALKEAAKAKPEGATPKAKKVTLTTDGSHVAIERGYATGRLIEIGEVVPAGVPVSTNWMAEAEDDEEPAPRKRAKAADADA